MKIIRAKDYNDMSRKAANIISAQVILKPESVLVDFGACTTFNLDEYRGLTPDHDQSYHYFMHKNFFDAVNVPDERINLPDGAQLDAERECHRYDAAIRAAGGIALQRPMMCRVRRTPWACRPSCSRAALFWSFRAKTRRKPFAKPSSAR